MTRHQRALLLTAVLPFALLASNGTAHADKEFNLNLPLDDDFDACAGERVRIVGVQHIVGRITEDGAGRMHFGFTRNTRGDGIGQTSGARYVMNDAVARASLEMPGGETRTYVENYSTRLIRNGESGSADDAMIHLLTVITVNANGDVTATVDVVRAECR